MNIFIRPISICTFMCVLGLQGGGEGARAGMETGSGGNGAMDRPRGSSSKRSTSSWSERERGREGGGGGRN